MPSNERRVSWLRRAARSIALLFTGYKSLWSSDRDVHSEKEWASGYAPEAEKPYEEAYDYALWRYTLAQAHWDDLDKKADDIGRYAALVVTAIGTVGTVAVAQLCHMQAHSILPLVPSVLFAVLSFGLAIIARSPTLLPIPGSARLVLDFAANPRITDGGQVKALVAASLHAATVGLRVVVKEKARRVSLSAWALLVSLAFLMLPLVLAGR